jgi:cytidyltransferase-like protein
MNKVFVSGCYDILHAGHIQFFEDAKALGNHLTVCFASNEVLWQYKHRKPALPEEHRRRILQSLSMVDEVVMSSNLDPVFDFKDHFLRLKPDILVSTEDDKHVEEKLKLCEEHGARYFQIPKRLDIPKVSTTEIREKINEVPLRVDFAGGWLDVPKFSKKGAYIVNCAITPKVSLIDWSYEKGAGLGGSAAYAILSGKDPVKSELDLGVGWQDPAVIEETGLCVWRSGEKPVLEMKVNPDFLRGHMALYWTGLTHDTPSNTDNERDYELIETAGDAGNIAVKMKSLPYLATAVELSYRTQLKEGMTPLPYMGELAKKYCGGGWGGYALYLFDERPKGLLNIEPYMK